MASNIAMIQITIPKYPGNIVVSHQAINRRITIPRISRFVEVTENLFTRKLGIIAHIERNRTLSSPLFFLGKSETFSKRASISFWYFSGISHVPLYEFARFLMYDTLKL